MRCVRFLSLGVVVLAAIAACGGASTSPAPASSAIVTAAPTSTPAPTVDGKVLARAVVAKFAADPFIAHVEQVGTVTAGGVTGHVSGSIDVNGDDSRWVMQVSAPGLTVEAEVVILGEDVWVRTGDQATRTTRGALGELLTALERAYRIVDDPDVLSYAGTEMVDGRELNRLTAPAGLVEYADSNTTGYYDVFDLYVLADGTPVAVKGTFTARNDDGSEGTGTTEIRFSGFGGPITIEEPSFVLTPISTIPPESLP